ncbi:hypothetical protein Zmor_006584 [Zophobas morio]|uniref:Uncharacterized protein n=1 Tax=Zophobas morio TaxID=2755281 RepID=A0AA38MNP1_9CUCU|nr:hypothetical protein Zmor_006584 [Zophobas morio]
MKIVHLGRPELIEGALLQRKSICYTDVMPMGFLVYTGCTVTHCRRRRSHKEKPRSGSPKLWKSRWRGSECHQSNDLEVTSGSSRNAWLFKYGPPPRASNLVKSIPVD